MPNKEAVLAEISRDVLEQFKDRPGFVMNVYGCSVFEDYIDYRGLLCHSPREWIKLAMKNTAASANLSL